MKNEAANQTDPMNAITDSGYSWYQNEFYRLCQIDDEKVRNKAKQQFHTLNDAGTPASYWNPKPKTETSNMTNETSNQIDIAKYEAQTTSPGKFEGESALTPYLYDLSMEGDGDPLNMEFGDDPQALEFELTPEEMKTFDTKQAAWVLIEDSNGFAYAMTLKNYQG